MKKLYDRSWEILIIRRKILYTCQREVGLFGVTGLVTLGELTRYFCSSFLLFCGILKCFMVKNGYIYIYIWHQDSSN